MDAENERDGAGGRGGGGGKRDRERRGKRERESFPTRTKWVNEPTFFFSTPPAILKSNFVQRTNTHFGYKHHQNASNLSRESNALYWCVNVKDPTTNVALPRFC